MSATWSRAYPRPKKEYARSGPAHDSHPDHFAGGLLQPRFQVGFAHARRVRQGEFHDQADAKSIVILIKRAVKELLQYALWAVNPWSAYPLFGGWPL
jgi:hypothetical protein